MSSEELSGSNPWSTTRLSSSSDQRWISKAPAGGHRRAASALPCDPPLPAVVVSVGDQDWHCAHRPGSELSDAMVAVLPWLRPLPGIISGVVASHNVLGRHSHVAVAAPAGIGTCGGREVREAVAGEGTIAAGAPAYLSCDKCPEASRSPPTFVTLRDVTNDKHVELCRTHGGGLGGPSGPRRAICDRLELLDLILLASAQVVLVPSPAAASALGAPRLTTTHPLPRHPRFVRGWPGPRPRAARSPRQRS